MKPSSKQRGQSAIGGYAKADRRTRGESGAARRCPRRRAVLSEGAEGVAVETLRQAGAVDIEHAEGVWQDGEWKNFDPVAPIQLVDEGGS